MSKIKDWLKPPQFEGNQRDNRTAYLLNIVSISYLLVLGMMTTFGVLEGGVSNINSETFVVLANRVLPIVIAFVVAQVSMRRGNITLASYSFVIILWLNYAWNIWQYGGLQASTLSNAILIVVIAGLLIGTRGIALVGGASVAYGIFVLVLQAQGIISSQEIRPVERFIAVTLSIILSSFYLSLYTRSLYEALTEAETANVKLMDIRSNLELRVREQTRDLTLAAEIGQAVSQIHELDKLLATAVERIRSHFNLYYIQIYLFNEKDDSLQLTAGTGQIGQELTRRGHRLVSDANSINGLAAAEKRSIVVPDTATNPLFRPNPMLPRTRSEMAVPLIIRDRLVGVLDLQSEEKDALSTESIPAFEILAGQLAAAVENTKLIQEAAEARLEALTISRRIMREGWSSYLDALERPQFVGFSYENDNKDVQPLTDPLPVQRSSSRNVTQVAIDVIGETIGSIQFEAGEDETLTPSDVELIQTIARQVGQQVEILRSLDEAAHYRQQAETTLRQMTHEAWRDYQETQTLASGFVYDQLMVQPVSSSDALADTAMLHHELALHGESVAELAIAKTNHLDEQFANELITAVSDQLVAHMENLRLTEQTEKALAESQRRGRELSVINTVAEATADLTAITEFLATVQKELEKVLPLNSFTVAAYNEEDNTVTFEYAYDEKSGLQEDTPPINLEPHHLSYKTITEGAPQIIHFTETEVTAQKQNRPPNMMSEEATVTASLLFVPLLIGQDVVGIMSVQSYQFNAYTQEHIDLLTGVAGYVVTAIQKTRLFEQTQARATELAVLNDVAQVVSQSLDRQQMITTVHTQIQRIFPVDAFFIALYDPQNNLLEYPYIHDNGQTYQIGFDTPSPTSIVYQVLKTGDPVIINRTQQEIDDLTDKNKETRLGDTSRVSASLLYIPLWSGQEVNGVLSIQSYELNAYRQENISLLSSVATHVSLALDNIRLLTETRRAAENEQILRNISATINTAIDAESVLQTTARELGRVLGLETFVYLKPELNMTAPAAQQGKDNGDNLR